MRWHGAGEGVCDGRLETVGLEMVGIKMVGLETAQARQRGA